MADLPLIPVSPLVKASTASLDNGVLAELTHQMQSVQSASPSRWDVDILASQIAAVHRELFQRTDLNNLQQSPMIDFHRYLVHSVAHQVMYWSHPEDLVAQMIRVAYLLLHAYRDFSGFSAILKALKLPEVRRLKKVWQPCSTRTKQMCHDLWKLISPADSYQAYFDCLRRKLQVFGINSGMIAVPWIEPHLTLIQSIHDTYGAADGVLAEPGMQKLTTILSDLSSCQSHSETANLRQRRKSITIKPVQMDGAHSVMPPTNLSLVASDPLVYHWLVSRPYLTREQLMKESTEIEPLRPDEELLVVDEFVDPTPVVSEHNTLEDTQSLKQHVEHVEQEETEESAQSITPEIAVSSQVNRTSGDKTLAEEEKEEPEQEKQSPPVPRLSPLAPEFVPSMPHHNSDTHETEDDLEEQWTGYPVENLYTSNEHDERDDDDDDDDDEVWRGYPCPESSSLSETSEEWKGYHAMCEEAKWKAETTLKVQQQEWQGYALEASNEDDLDSSSMMRGEFVKSQPLRDPLESFKRTATANNRIAIGKAAARRMQGSNQPAASRSMPTFT
ncbi:hypothetical protein DFQ28_005794 [Apophysomyces sp. BC1034]|nr:hypothetical protein DFQ30_005110 [Apophysomyces sp. BC1015]KAG0177567.1 hypothetical protein DFQ29_004682 [Apophysomyces sp. BC1021]KAG0187830.1 hypothetical protein DFQ28_005794 [Apophysomyces sp. BC1034]